VSTVLRDYILYLALSGLIQPGDPRARVRGRKFRNRTRRTRDVLLVEWIRT
jgi:hypothetical protein